MPALTHVVIGTNDLTRARAFYDATLATLGLRRLKDYEGRASMWGAERPEFMVATPANGLPATWSNGGTVSFAAPTHQAVRKFHEIAIENGAVDEGAPGPRTFLPNAYGAYVRDPDGNKICAFCFSES
jgi:catechol 2,3-dioxygenase-like lactoylglutathione lyase family enzyme